MTVKGGIVVVQQAYASYAYIRKSTTASWSWFFSARYCRSLQTIVWLTLSTRSFGWGSYPVVVITFRPSFVHIAAKTFCVNYRSLSVRTYLGMRQLLTTCLMKTMATIVAVVFVVGIV